MRIHYFKYIRYFSLLSSSSQIIIFSIYQPTLLIWNKSTSYFRFHWRSFSTEWSCHSEWWSMRWKIGIWWFYWMSCMCSPIHCISAYITSINLPTGADHVQTQTGYWHRNIEVIPIPPVHWTSQARGVFYLWLIDSQLIKN